MFNININNIENITIENCNMSSPGVSEPEQPSIAGRSYFIFDAPLSNTVFSTVQGSDTELQLANLTLMEPMQRFTVALAVGGFTIMNVVSNGFILPLGITPGSEVGLQFDSQSDLRFWSIEVRLLELNYFIARLKNIQTGYYLKVDSTANPIFSIVEDVSDASNLGFAACVS